MVNPSQEPSSPVVLPPENVPQTDRVIGAVCYVPFGFLAPLATDKSSDFLAFHSRQGMVVFFGWCILWALLPSLWVLTWLLYIGLIAFMASKTLKGDTYRLPLPDFLVPRP